MFSAIGTGIIFNSERYVQLLRSGIDRRQYHGDVSEGAPYNFDRLYPICLEYAMYYFQGHLSSEKYKKGVMLTDEQALQLFKEECDFWDIGLTLADEKRFMTQWKQDMKRDMF